jgi:site-specific DNA-methyltransferase (adenine-specific)
MRAKSQRSTNEQRQLTTQIEIIQGNCLEVMHKLALERGAFVDLMFCDPPYFLSNGGVTCQNGRMAKVHKGDWDRSQGYEKNLEFNISWLKACEKLLKPDASMMVSGTFHSIYSIGFAMQSLGMKLLNNITWQKPNPPPNLSCRYFTHSTETIIWAAKDLNAKHKFNYDLMRELNGGKQMKDVWLMTSPGKNEKECGKHPTQKPLQLIDRLILAATDPNEVVLDPFNGSGTTGVSCINNGRSYIGIELDPAYVSLTKKRFIAANKLLKKK